MRLLRRRDHGVVADQVVEAGQAGGAVHAEPGGDDRGRPMAEQRQPGELAVAVEVDQEVELLRLDDLGGVRVGKPEDLVEPVRGVPAVAGLQRGRGVVREEVDFDPLPVVVVDDAQTGFIQLRSRKKDDT